MAQTRTQGIRVNLLTETMLKRTTKTRAVCKILLLILKIVVGLELGSL